MKQCGATAPRNTVSVHAAISSALRPHFDAFRRLVLQHARRAASSTFHGALFAVTRKRRRHEEGILATREHSPGVSPDAPVLGLTPRPSDATLTTAWRAGAGGAADRLRELARARTRVALLLTGAVVLLYFSFIGAVAFARPALAWLVAPGLSLGIVLGAAVIVASWLLTWVYVRWANAHYDPALRALRE